MYVHMEGVVREVTALVADSQEKLCRLVSEFGRLCERRKLRVNVGTHRERRSNFN